MWLANAENTVVINSDNVGYIFIAYYDESIVIRAHMHDGNRVTLRKFLHEDEKAAFDEFAAIQARLERDHQRRWRY